jgi:uncharacterized protein YndB with AHSA1/START domain
MKWVLRIAGGIAAVLGLILAVLGLMTLRADAGRIQASVTVRQSPQAVWPYLYEPDKLKAWVSWLQEVRSTPGEPAVGTQSVWVMKDANNRDAKMEIASRVEAVEPARLLAVRLGADGAFQGSAAYRLVDAGQGQTRVELDSRYRFQNRFAQLMMPLIAASAKNKMNGDFARLKSAVEAH